MKKIPQENQLNKDYNPDHVCIDEGKCWANKIY